VSAIARQLIGRSFQVSQLLLLDWWADLAVQAIGIGTVKKNEK